MWLVRVELGVLQRPLFRHDVCGGGGGSLRSIGGFEFRRKVFLIYIIEVEGERRRTVARVSFQKSMFRVDGKRGMWRGACENSEHVVRNGKLCSERGRLCETRRFA